MESRVMRKTEHWFFLSIMLWGSLCSMDYSGCIVKALSSWSGKTNNDLETLMRARYMVQKALFFVNQFNSGSDDCVQLALVKSFLDQACSSNDIVLNKPVYDWAEKQTRVVACAHANQIREALLTHGLISFTTK